MNIFKLATETFDELYGSMTFPVFLFDEKGRLINANQSFLDLTGISLEDIETLSMVSFLKKVFKDGMWFLKALPENHVTEITDINGKSFPVGVNYKKLKTENESYGGGLGFITDLREVIASRERIKKITVEYEALKEQLAGEVPDIDLQEKKKLEQEVKETKDFLENVLESCGDGIAIADGTAVITRANKLFATMLGKTKSEIEGKYIYELTPPMGTYSSTTGETITLGETYKDNQINHVIKFLESEEDAQADFWEWYALKKNGDIIPLESTGTIQKNTEGVITVAVMVARDITERKKAEKEIKEAKDFLENVIESCGDGIAITDGAGMITRVNEFFAAMLGKKRNEVEGTFIYELANPIGTFRSTTGETVTVDQSLRENQLTHINKFFESGGDVLIENWQWYALHKNGNVVPIEASATVQKNSEGVLTGAVMSARDITERKKAEKEIKEAKDFLENVLESCGDGIFIVDGSARITRVNESFASMLGKTKQELEGAYIYELGPSVGTFRSTTGEMIALDQAYYSYSLSLHEKNISQFEDTIKIQNWEYYLYNKNGDLVPFELTVTIQQNSRGDITGGVGSARDITERKKAEKALQEANEFRSRFFTNITHEFRTPLTLAISPMEGILRGEFGKANKEITEQLSIALRNSRQLLKLVNQLLDFSRLESGAKHVVREKKDLKKFIAAILDSFSMIAKKKKIKLTLDSAADISRVSIDAGKMEKVLFNLIGNAFKFTPEKGGITVSIEKGSDVIDENDNADSDMRDYVIISVSDTGIGIKEEEIKTIFDRFSQVAGGSSWEHGGTGLGLAHASELVEFMGGHIAVQSEYGKGSTFSVNLPVERQQIGGEAEVSGEPEEELYLQPEVELSDIKQEGDVLQESLSGKKPLILIVDDNPDMRQYISGIVKKEYDFITAGNGNEGLKRLEKHTPDVILCDVMMPGMDGHEFLERVKSQPGLQLIPFIFLTARADVEMKVEGLEEGADDYIVKPFNSLELLARVKSLLRIRDLMSRTEAQKKKISSLTQKLQKKYRYGNIIGNSPPMRKIYQMIETIKDSDSNVLITGETGTGKELIANAIHYNSPRKKGPMISVNCGAIPRELMEREFFGHVKGAYTGAVESRKGYFQEADKGTLFLDEIGEMDRDMQVKLLRVLERGEITRVGDSAPTKVDVRLIVATNKNLLAEVQKGSFREDLYYRIHVIPIHLPPLRQRKEDMPLLIEHFLKSFQSRQKKELPALTEREMNLFMNYSYPGNVRELENIVERFCLLGGKAENLFSYQPEGPGRVSEDYSSDEIFASTKPLKAAAQKAKAQAEKEVIIQALKICDNDYGQTAKKLNICLASLYNKIKECGVSG